MAATAPTIDGRRDPEHTPRLSPVRAVVAMTRPTHIALVVLIFTNGALLALWREGSSGSVAAALSSAWPALLLVVLAGAAIHLANEAADDETDRLTERTPFSGGSGALTASSVDPRVPLTLGLGASGVVLVGAVAAVATGVLPAPASVLLVVGLVGGLAYSLPPIAAARRGWGEPLDAVLGALVLPLYGGAAVVGAISSRDIVAFLPLFFVVLASVMATAWPDRVADAAAGKLPMQVRLGPRTLRRIALASAAAFVMTTIVSVAAGAAPLAITGLAVTPLVVVGLSRYTRVADPSASVAAMVGWTAIGTAILLVGLGAGGRLV
jgi:1,4-dihydroxy-2-naphthoate octaprenyltransferase